MTTPEACVHFWVIEPAAGPTSPGVCRHCGGTREFRNVVPAQEEGNWRYQNAKKARENNLPGHGGREAPLMPAQAPESPVANPEGVKW